MIDRDFSLGIVERSFWLIGIILLAIMVFSATKASGSTLAAYAARIAGDDGRTRIVMDFNQRPDFSIHYVIAPNRVIIDLPETSFDFKPEAFQALGLFSDIRYGQMGEGRSRIVFTAARPLKINRAEVLENGPQKGFRLVIDCEMTTQKQFADLVKQQKWINITAPPIFEIRPAIGNDDFLIAVDAGHGGVDTGATGVDSKIQEKTITLDFASELTDRLNKESGLKAFLVRDRDVFISLSERVAIARQRGAKLFISLHADNLRQKEIRGATVYTLSDNASDSFAADLAARENLSDVIGGVASQNEPEEVTDILIDLTRRETQAFSVKLAESVVASFEGQIRLINNPHRQAGFRVLQAPDVPSILLELGFLSNLEDEKMLLDSKWRVIIAQKLTDAIRIYRNPDLAKGR